MRTLKALATFRQFTFLSEKVCLCPYRSRSVREPLKPWKIPQWNCKLTTWSLMYTYTWNSSWLCGISAMSETVRNRNRDILRIAARCVSVEVSGNLFADRWTRSRDHESSQPKAEFIPCQNVLFCKRIRHPVPWLQVHQTTIDHDIQIQARLS